MRNLAVLRQNVLEGPGRRKKSHGHFCADLAAEAGQHGKAEPHRQCQWTIRDAFITCMWSETFPFASLASDMALGHKRKGWVGCTRGAHARPARPPPPHFFCPVPSPPPLSPTVRCDAMRGDAMRRWCMRKWASRTRDFSSIGLFIDNFKNRLIA